MNRIDNQLPGVGNIVSNEINQKTSVPSGGLNFADLLKNELEQTNKLEQDANKASVDIATGTVKDLHKANIAIEKAEMNMKLMLEVRNKAISAYKELIKTQM